MQTSFGDINVRFDDLINRLKALGLRANMNPGRREARVGDDTRGNLLLNHFMQILLAGMTTSFHLMKKIYLVDGKHK
jgi:hypothetical protein